MPFSRKEIFDIWLTQTGKGKDSAVLRYVSQQLILTGITEEDKIKRVMNQINIFLVNLRSRWIRSRYSQHNFLKKFPEFLTGNILEDEADLFSPSTSNANNCKSFKELGDKQKKRRIEHLLDNYTYEELSYATRLSLYASGQRDASALIRDVTENSPGRAKAIKKAYTTPKSLTKRYSPEEALSLYIQGRFTKFSYTLMQTGAKRRLAPIYPSYPLLLEAKKKCYPTENSISITGISAEVTLQALLDHTSHRLALALEENLKSDAVASDLTLYCKWGCDGSSGYSMYKQRFEEEVHELNDEEEPLDDYYEEEDELTNPEEREQDESCSPSDTSLYSICLVPLQLKTRDDNQLIWHNKKSSSPRFCRPIKIVFEKESTEQIKREISAIEIQIQNLEPTLINVGNSIVRIHYDLKMTMVDGKTISAYTGKSVQTCSICSATPKMMNDLPSIYSLDKDKSQYDFGVSSLHAFIRSLELFLNISYRLEICKWRIFKKDITNQAIFKKTKNKVQTQLQKQTGLLVDVVKQGLGSSNDGNTAARFFEEYTLVASITGIDEDLLKRFNIILQAISSGFSINIERFSAYTRKTAELYVSLYPWYPMPASVHKLLIHSPEIIESCFMAIGMMSEEALEARNKDLRRFREHNTRKFSRKSTMEDLFHTLLCSSDPYISTLADNDSGALMHSTQKVNPYPKELLELLSEPEIGE